MGILEQAKSINDIPYRLKLLLYGPPGVGKTTLAAHAPKPFFVDLERSTETLRGDKRFAHVKFHKPKSMQEVDEIVKEFPKSEFETLVIDTGTRLQFFQIHENMVEVASKNQSRDVHIPLFQEYRKSSEYLDEIFVKCQDMDKHLIIIAHERETTNDEGVVTKISPELTPAIAGRINGLLNVTAHYSIKPGIGTNPDKRILRVNPTGKIVAKNRLQIADSVIENPTIDIFFKGEFK